MNNLGYSIAGGGKRFLAFFLDFTIFLLLSFACYVGVCEPIANRTVNIAQVRKDYTQKCIDYGLQEPGDMFMDFSLINTPAYEAFCNDPEVIKLENTIMATTAIELVGSTLVPVVLVYLMMPLIFKNGQTVGKKVMDLSLITHDGLYVKPWRVIVRALAIWLLEIVGTVALMGVPLFISLMLVLATANRRALHDHIAGTVVSDIRDTVPFKTAKERADFMGQLEIKMRKTRSLRDLKEDKK